MNNPKELNVFQIAILSAIDKTAEQGQQSTTLDGCAYRAVSGKGEPLCCPLGHMITDDRYSFYLEGKVASEAPVYLAVEASLVNYKVTTEDMLVMSGIQSVHDGNSDFTSRYGEPLVSGANMPENMYGLGFYLALTRYRFDAGFYESIEVLDGVKEAVKVIKGDSLPDYIINHCLQKVKGMLNQKLN